MILLKARGVSAEYSFLGKVRQSLGGGKYGWGWRAK